MPPLLQWDEIDTVLVDMDGTLLDLAFDNFFWLELVPARYASREGISTAAARQAVAERYERVVGSLPWYCVDHWTRELGLDIAAMKRDHRHLIRYLPGAERFLGSVRARGKPLWIVTNAHRETIAVKREQTRIDTLVDDLVSSHDLAAPKERPEFWTALAERRRFDPERTLLIEDSLSVLAAARDYGIRHIVAIRQPDSRQPPRQIDGFPAILGVAELA